MTNHVALKTEFEVQGPDSSGRSASDSIECCVSSDLAVHNPVSNMVIKIGDEYISKASLMRIVEMTALHEKMLSQKTEAL